MATGHQKSVPVSRPDTAGFPAAIPGFRRLFLPGRQPTDQGHGLENLNDYRVMDVTIRIFPHPWLALYSLCIIKR
ncbi:MAG TPA: hypothetical protein ENI93_05790 [Gammaproteobacteria bacterium]|nr:hypothetical protein [Gammaproteobacteria bacterium]